MRLIVATGIVLLAGCSTPAPEPAETGELKTIKLPEGIDLGPVGGSAGSSAGMQRTSLPGGFAILHPEGWTVNAQAGRAELRSPEGDQFVLIQAVLGNGRVTANSVLEGLTRRGPVGPMEQTQVLATRGPASDTQALLRGQGRSGAMRGQALVALRGGAATVYAIGASEASFAGAAPRLVKILQSFTYAGEGDSQGAASRPAAGASNLRYRRVEDSRERAYSMEFPEGWKVDVGMYRVGTDLRPEATAQSPGGEILLFLNDRNVGPFAVPTEALRGFGIGEGGTYNPAGRPMLVWRYLPGAEFIKWWLPQKFNGARITGQQAQPEVARQIATARYQLGNPMGATLESGEVAFEYQGRRGRVHATTEIYGYEQVRSWAAIYHHGYLAAPGSEAMAAEALVHAIGTAQYNLQWLQMERKMQVVDAQNQMNAMRAINDVWRQTMTERSESAAAQSRAVGDLVSGTFRVLDPTTGETGTVQAGSNYYYRVPGTEGVVGTNTDQGRPVDLTPLIRIDWDRP